MITFGITHAVENASVSDKFPKKNNNCRGPAMNSLYRQPRGTRPDHKRLVVVMPEDELKAIDRWGLASGMESRTQAVRHLIKVGLEILERA
jgi:hypothetical protein